MDDARFLDELDAQARALAATWALAPGITPDDVADELERVAARLVAMAAECRCWDAGYDVAAA